MILIVKVADEIINTKGNNIYFAISTKMYLYPEDIFALWVIIAVRYR